VSNNEHSELPPALEKTPTCGWKTELNLTTNAPWNEKSLHNAIFHVWYHLWIRATKMFFLNIGVFGAVLFYFIALIVATCFGLLKMEQTILAVLPLIALTLGMGLRDAVKEVRVESFQVWLQKVYNVHINYVEAVLALTAFYHGVERYVLPTGGVVQRVNNGLIYTPNGQGVNDE